jgi:hypothetical protein
VNLLADSDDPQEERILAALKRLQLTHLRETLAAVLSQAAKEEWTYLEFLDQILRREVDAKQGKRIRMGMQIAHFPCVRTIEAFDFVFQPSADERLIRELSSGNFIAHGENVLIFGPPGVGNLAQRNTPLVTEECEGHVTVNDPSHPLYGRTLKLSGLACLPGHIRHCQVEVLPGQIAYIPVASTDLSTEPRPEPTVLTLAALEELVASFQAVRRRRRNHEAHPKSPGLDTPGTKRARRRRREDRPGPHGGRGT